MNAKTTPRSDHLPRVLDIPSVHVAVSRTYADGSLNIVQGVLGDELAVQLHGGDTVARIATDGVVLVASDRVVLIAFGDEPELLRRRPEHPTIGGLELLGRADVALQLATQAIRRVAKSES